MKKSKKSYYLITIIILAVIAVIFILFALTRNNNIQMTSKTCPAVKEYLKKADKKGTGKTTISKGNEIVVDYIGRLEDGKIFDTSVEEAAKGCGLYNEGRDYSQGLPFTVGAGQMIAGFDKAVTGMKIGQTKTITIAPEDAYGLPDKAMIVKIPIDKLPNAEQYKVGSLVASPLGGNGSVTKITKTEIVVDYNHELAGKELIFDITILEIKNN